ncbi:MAG: hypothetical protein ACLUNZ_03425 [Evtepia sp.]
MRQETDEQKQRAAIGKRAGLVGLLCNFLLAGGSWQWGRWRRPWPFLQTA